MKNQILSILKFILLFNSHNNGCQGQIFNQILQQQANNSFSPKQCWIEKSIPFSSSTLSFRKQIKKHLVLRGGQQTESKPGYVESTIPPKRSTPSSASSLSSVKPKKKRKKKTVPYSSSTSIKSPSMTPLNKKYHGKTKTVLPTHVESKSSTVPKPSKQNSSMNSSSLPSRSSPNPQNDKSNKNYPPEKNESGLEESRHDKMPSLFTSADEIQYDTYAACLAATESLRRMRDSKAKNRKGTAVSPSSFLEGNSWKSLLNRVGSAGVGNSSDGSNDVKSLSPVAGTGNEEHKRACAEYVLNSSKAIKALGLSVSQFNQIGREISKNTSLKEKVMEQAYLYRMASTIKMDKIPLIQDPDSKQLLKSTRRRRVQMFVKSITEIEDLREDQTNRLRKALKIDSLPSNINLCDPNVLPLLSPQVKSVIEAFPLQAEVIVKKYGLNSDEFNQMLEKTRGNPVFRWRVQRFRNKQKQ